MVALQVEGVSPSMEVDTGVAYSVITEVTFHAAFSHLKLRPSEVLLKSYTTKRIQVLRQLNVHVHYDNQALTWSSWLWQVMARASWGGIGSITFNSIGRRYMPFQNQPNSPTSYVRTASCSRMNWERFSSMKLPCKYIQMPVPDSSRHNHYPLRSNPASKKNWISWKLVVWLNKLSTVSGCPNCSSSEEEWAVPHLR